MTEAYYAAASKSELINDDFGEIQQWCTDADDAMDVYDGTPPVTPPAVITEKLAYLSSLLEAARGGADKTWVDLGVLGSPDQVVPRAACRRDPGFELSLADLDFL